jgi:hypothetical protein
MTRASFAAIVTLNSHLCQTFYMHDQNDKLISILIFFLITYSEFSLIN